MRSIKSTGAGCNPTELDPMQRLFSRMGTWCKARPSFLRFTSAALLPSAFIGQSEI